MATRSIIFFGDDTKGRYVHFDGDLVGRELRAIIKRDGLEKARETIMSHNWTFIDADFITESFNFRGVTIEGYGSAFKEDDGFIDLEKDDISFADYIHTVTRNGAVKSRGRY